MQNDRVAYSFEPGRLSVHGGQEVDVVALSLRIGDGGVRIATRDGTLSDDELTVSFDELVAVEATRATTYSLALETEHSVYEVTNVTPDHGQIEDVLSYLRERIPSDEQTVAKPGTDSARHSDADDRSGEGDHPDDAQSEPRQTDADLDEWVWGGTESDDSPDERVGPGERFTCPECGDPIELPGSLPRQQRTVNCPNCGSNIGRTPAEEEVVVVQR